jgi:uncharacterized membrane protein YfcA
MHIGVTLDTQGWMLAILGALLVGLNKGGLPGIGNVTVAIFAVILPSKESVGILLPVLICADIVAVATYKKHADWKHLWRLLPPAAIGVYLGFLLFNRMDNRQVRVAIGVILLVLTALHFLRQGWLRRTGTPAHADPLPHTRWFSSLIGLLCGVTTMLANAAGPIAQVFLLSAGLPKYAFIGTGAWFFLLINTFKIPFQIAAGGISADNLAFSLLLGVLSASAAAVAPRIVKYIPQRLFDTIVWVVIVLSAVKLIF